MQGPPGTHFGAPGSGFGTPPSSPFGSAPSFGALAPFPGVAAQRAYAGFWIRFLAYMIDYVILGVSYGVIVGSASSLNSSTVTGILLTLWLIGLLAYVIYLPAIGGTLGQRVCQLRIVNASDDSSNIGIGKSLLRFLGFLIGSAVFDLGLIWVAFDAEKQGWQDKIAQTHVIHK